MDINKPEPIEQQECEQVQVDDVLDVIKDKYILGAGSTYELEKLGCVHSLMLDFEDRTVEYHGKIENGDPAEKLVDAWMSATKRGVDAPETSIGRYLHYLIGRYL